VVTNPPAMQETWVRSPGWEDLLEKGMATHSSILAWRIPWTEEPGVYSPWGHKESDTIEHACVCVCMCVCVSPGEFPGDPIVRSLRFHSWGKV